MDNRELKKVMLEADKNLDELKDRCHELFIENEKLKDKIKKVIEYNSIKATRKENYFSFVWH